MGWGGVEACPEKPKGTLTTIVLNPLSLFFFLCVFFVVFETGFLCIVLAILELVLWTRQAGLELIENHLPLPSESWN